MAYSEQEILGKAIYNVLQDAAIPEGMKKTSEIIAEAFEKADDLSVRVQRIAERLCGVLPVASSANVIETSLNDGLLPLINDHSVSVVRNIARAHAALDRLESML